MNGKEQGAQPWVKDRRDAEQEGCGTGGMQNRRDAVQEG